MKYALLLALPCTLSCAATLAPRPGVEATPHLGESWFTYRAQGLGITVAEAKARDEALPEDDVPEGFYDQQTAAEGAALWGSLCASCHGIDGRVDEELAATMNPPPREWGGMGPAMGFFFGGDAMRAGIYRSIRDGAKPDDPSQPQVMVPWGPVLAREQIWALVYHIESL